MKFIIVTGGVLSGLGKGISASSIGRLLKSRGIKVTAIKVDPYLNCDAGTMNPYQHGEVFVLDDGGEVDLDLGNYERFLDMSLTRDHNITTGKVYRAVIEKERKGDYLGKTVQIIPHITDEIKQQIKSVAERDGAQVCIVEMGGTVGDIEGMPFLEAVRQLGMEVGKSNVCYIHTTLVPILGTVGEPKTKPTQQSVRELRSVGIQPNVIVARSGRPLDSEIKKKIAFFCDVPVEGVISAPDAPSIYDVPILFEKQGVSDFLLNVLDLKGTGQNLTDWKEFINRIKNPTKEVEIAIVGKYTSLKDSYISHIEALHHAAAVTRVGVKIRWIESTDIESDGTGLLDGVNGILIPGGFGDRGTEGKIKAVTYARENRIPFQGVCLGFQLATVEFARNVMGMEGADSSEFESKTSYPVIDLLPEQKDVKDMGATMRLGAHKVLLNEGCKTAELYKTLEIYERHRHRYEVNPDFIEKFENKGLKFVGRSEDGRRMEVLELADHPYFVASQFHPELKSRPFKPSPMHLGLVMVAADLT